jgi:hypothetical protein
MARPVVVMLAVVAAVVAAADAAATPPVGRRLGRDEPVIVGRPSAEVRWRLERAHADALQRLDELPACRALFESLGADGRDTLGRMVYREASSEVDLDMCARRSAAAITTVGGRGVALCPSTFERLTLHGATALVLHEALHHAGLTEAPQTSGARTSREISTRVHRACGL